MLLTKHYQRQLIEETLSIPLLECRHWQEHDSAVFLIPAPFKPHLHYRLVIPLAELKAIAALSYGPYKPTAEERLLATRKLAADLERMERDKRREERNKRRNDPDEKYIQHQLRAKRLARAKAIEEELAADAAAEKRIAKLKALNLPHKTLADAAKPITPKSDKATGEPS